MMIPVLLVLAIGILAGHAATRVWWETDVPLYFRYPRMFLHCLARFHRFATWYEGHDNLPPGVGAYCATCGSGDPPEWIVEKGFPQ